MGLFSPPVQHEEQDRRSQPANWGFQAMTLGGRGKLNSHVSQFTIFPPLYPKKLPKAMQGSWSCVWPCMLPVVALGREETLTQLCLADCHGLCTPTDVRETDRLPQPSQLSSQP